ncbi:molecular chaperone [Rhodanobacter aciditrophus]|uniref:Molecular chaperone n=1 Tax=Rhodanobacter aciditrophus TaxID=1623218 RepID=A0ABW4B3C7_9GAMM
MLQSLFFHIKTAALVLLLGLSVAPSFADILISPTRITLDERNRSAAITLINPGNETRAYRIGWKQLIALPQGGYRELTEQEKQQFSSIERIIRVSPKQVTLQPGQRQTVKLLLRKQQGMMDGEYRSHLTLTALPPLEKKAAPKQQGPSFQLNMLTSYTLPILYREGKLSVNPSITNLSLVTQKDSGITYIKVAFTHRDKFSSHGRLIALWQPKGGSQRQVGILNGYNLYPETPNAQIQFPWESFKLEPGTLTVRFEGQQEFSGQVFSTKTLTITPQMIRSVQ